MRNLSETLLAAQKQASHSPFVKLEAVNKVAGVTRLNFSRLYTGSEEEHYHSLTIPGDGSLIRVRIGPASDQRKLYWQRVADPGPGSDFSQWTYANQYNINIAAAASLGAEVSIFFINSILRIYRLKSTDYGISWSDPEFVDFCPSIYLNGITAAYKPNGDLALFFTSQTDLYVKKLQSGQWQALSNWDKATGDLTGVATVYDGDWNLFVTGQDTGGNFRLWSLVYGDGGDVTAGTWSELNEFAQAPSSGDFEYRYAFLGKPDVSRCFYVEEFTGTEAYSRIFRSYSIPGTKFVDSLWLEPLPFNLISEYGLAIAHHGDYCWLSRANGVWRAPLTADALEITADVLSLKQEIRGCRSRLTIELANDDGRFSPPPPPLAIGCQLNLGPGYTTTQGNEVSPGQSFVLEAYEYTSSGSRASLVLHAVCGWSLVANWQARYQFRWNKDTDQASIRDILSFIMARAGLKLEVISESSLITSYYPDFTISPTTGGDVVITNLLSFVPDVLFIEGGKVYLINPLAEDSPVYSYTSPHSQTGVSHPILEGRYDTGALKLNRIQVEGYDSGAGSSIIVDCFDWEELENVYERFLKLEDKNIGSVSQAQDRGQTLLREAEIESTGGFIRIPVNCGQQMYDVIGITDARAGLDAQKRRVLGITLVYNPGRGQYEQSLLLGKV